MPPESSDLCLQNQNNFINTFVEKNVKEDAARK
jgi:hypothetical protein